MRFEPPEGGCGHYRKGIIILDVALPGHVPYCQYCPMAKYEESLRRYSCRAMRVENWLFDPFHGRPEWCPIQWEEPDKKED